jgi:dipeptide/tripeptide permease
MPANEPTREPRPRPADERAKGPSGLDATMLPIGELLAVAFVLVALVVVGGWLGFALAVVSMIAGIVGLSRYIQRIAGRREPPAHR